MIRMSGKYDALYEEALRAGLATPEEVAWMRQHGIRPATKRWEPPTPLKQRPAWLAFMLRTADRHWKRSSFSRHGIEPEQTMISATHDLERVYEEAARSGLYTPEQLARMRRMRIRPSTHPIRSSDQLVRKRPAWLAFVLRLFS